MKQVVHDIALEIGGSHYPAVGGRLLEQSILMAVQRCIDLALANGDEQTVLDISEYFDIGIDDEPEDQIFSI